MGFRYYWFCLSHNLLIPKTFPLPQSTRALSASTSTNQFSTPAPTGDRLIKISGLNDQSLGSVSLLTTLAPTGDWLLSISGGNPQSFSTSLMQVPTWPPVSFLSYPQSMVRNVFFVNFQAFGDLLFFLHLTQTLSLSVEKFYERIGIG